MWTLQALSDFFLFLQRVAKSWQWKSSSLGCQTRAAFQVRPKQTSTYLQLLTLVSKAGSNSWDYSLTMDWEYGRNFYRGCKKGIVSGLQQSCEAAIVLNCRIWSWQADYSALQHSDPNRERHRNFDVFNVVHGCAVVGRTDPFMLSQVFFF